MIPACSIPRPFQVDDVRGIYPDELDSRRRHRRTRTRPPRFEARRIAIGQKLEAYGSRF
jgi:hypothetical protein